MAGKYEVANVSFGLYRKSTEPLNTLTVDPFSNKQHCGKKS